MTEAQKRATAKYKAAKYTSLRFEIPKEEYEAMNTYLAQTGEPRATFIRRIIKEAINEGTV